MREFKILIVEDDLEWVKIFQDMLEKNFSPQELTGGHYGRAVVTHVANQADADRAVALAEREGFSYDLVLLDLVYPPGPSAAPDKSEDWNRGMKWLPELRRLQPNATIVILTSYPDLYHDLKNAVSAIRDHNANDFIPKTEGFHNIIARIRVAWDNARRMQLLMMLEEEFRSLLRTRAARTYGEDIAALLGRFKTSLHRITARLRSGDPSVIAATADDLKREFNTMNEEFVELTNLLNEGKERRKQVDVVAMVRQMTLLYERMLDNVHAEVVLPNAARSVVLTTYEGDLKVALNEVITNAMYALGGSSTPAKRRELSITVDEIEGGAVIRVADNGDGFSDEAMDRRFERGYTSRSEQSKGMGLYIAKRMMRQIGGDITLRNRPEGGAEVELIVQHLGSP